MSSTDPWAGDAAGALDADQRAADLNAAIDGLSRVAIGAQSLEASLERIARLAVLAIPGADGVGVTMIEERHADTICASDPFVREFDEVQYQVDEGPCITAAAEGRTVISGEVGSDGSWPRLGPRVRRLDVNSVLAVPLLMPEGEVIGAMNVYAHASHVFDADTARTGEAFAATAAVTVHNARALMQAHRLVGQLREALGSRATIDQAVGIVMSRQGGSPQDAFATLKRLSQNQNVKLALVAEELVREAVMRARARHSGAETD